MNRSGKPMIALVLFACLATVSCSAPEARPSAPSTAPPAGSVASAAPLVAANPASSPGTVDAGVQQRVKNLCMDQLKAQASGATPAPGQLRAQKVTLVRVKYLGEIRQISLPDSASRYELGIEFDYKIGNDDSKTATKFCRVNMADSTVDWQWNSTP